MRTLPFLLLTTACLLPVGPGADPPDPRDYDNTCDVVEDCAVVVWQSFACGCDCDSLYALNAEAALVFEADQAAYKPKKCTSYCDLGCYPISPGDAVLDCVDQVCQVSGGIGYYSSY